MNSLTLKQTWFSNLRLDVLSGILVALALIPEAIAFSIIAGVDPKVGLYASFIIAITISFVGGRPAMISAATGAMALVMVHLVKEHGLEYLWAATLLTGVLQVVFGVFKLARYIRFVPRPVMVGFVNALAILIFMAQLPQLAGGNVQVYLLVLLGLGIIYGLPLLTRAVPSALVAILVVTGVAIFSGMQVPTVGDMGQLPSSLPFFHFPQVPFTFETLQIIFPVALALSLVGLVESLLTANLLDEYTETTSDKNQESVGQGVANLLSGLFGGMAGCAMIGQSMINVKSGGRTRLSTLVAGVFLVVLILLLEDFLVKIPMAALVAVMVMVSVGTFDWKSIPALRKQPLTESIVMIATVLTVVFTHDLSKGVILGVILSAVFFARKVSQLSRVDIEHKDGERIYRVLGQVFFVSTHEFVSGFQYTGDVHKVTIDLTHAHIWDGSAVAALDKVVAKYRKLGVQVEVLGLNEASQTLIDRLAEYPSGKVSSSMH